MQTLTAGEAWIQFLIHALCSGAFSGASGAFSGAFSAVQVHMTCIEHNHKQQQKSWVLFWRFFWRFWRFCWRFFWRFTHSGFTGFTGTARVALVVAELVAVSVALVAAVVVLVEVADRLDADPKKGFGRAWRTHSSQITQSSAQSECSCRRVQRSDSAKDKKATVSAFLEWHTLQGIVWSRA